MAQGAYIGVNDKARKVKGIYIGVDGKARKVKKVYLGVNGVAKLVYQSNKSLAELPVGSSVFLRVDGVATEFLIVHQGLPDATLYDSSCDGTWLLMKNVYSSASVGDVQYGTNNADFGKSYVWEKLNTYVFPAFDANVQNLIKQVKIPYYKGSGASGAVASGANGLSTKLFLLGGYEVGWTTANGAFPVDGAVLDYFKGSAESDARRIAYYPGGTQAGWWLRSTVTNSYKSAWDTYDGDPWNDNFNTTCALRPALILPSTALVDDNMSVIA